MYTHLHLVSVLTQNLSNKLTYHNFGCLLIVLIVAALVDCKEGKYFCPGSYMKPGACLRNDEVCDNKCLSKEAPFKVKVSTWFSYRNVCTSCEGKHLYTNEEKQLDCNGTCLPLGKQYYKHIQANGILYDCGNGILCDNPNDRMQQCNNNDATMQQCS